MMKNVYILTHNYKIGIKMEYIESKLIGIFSSNEKAKEVIKKYKFLPGFNQFSVKCFHIEQYLINVNHKTKFDSVFILEHSYEIGDYDVCTTVGVYLTKEEAEEVLEQCKNKEEFREHSIDCFYIGNHKLDKCEWEEGFFKWSRVTKSEIKEE